MRAVAASLAVSFVLLTGASSWAYYLDKGRNFDVRFRGYSQVSVSAESSRDVNPQFDPGDVFGQRNFYNPEFEAKLTDYASWMHDVPGLSLISPEEFKFRFAWWGFYDGIYDYAAPQWNRARNGILTGDAKARYAKLIAGSGADPSLGPMTRQSQSDNIRRESFAEIDESRNLNGILRHRNRINEMYLDYTKGRIFIRAGRQAISWGESDSISQLDVSNPFELTQTAPGFFQDVDEARIPLWTLRSTVKLVDSWKALSSFFADSYVVPGIIDTTVPITPSWFGQPGSQAGYDPEAAALFNPKLTAVPSLFHVSVVDELPANTWANTRWGVRLTGVLLRDYTVQGWFFRTFPNQPVPQLVGTGDTKILMDNRGNRVSSCVNADGTPVVAKGAGPKIGHTSGGRECGYSFPLITVLHHHLESVAGLSATWFSQPLNGIIRTEAEYFVGEQSVIPNQNLNPAAVSDPTLNHVPTANYLRFILGYDTFFFMRALNPSNSFVFVMQYQGQINTTSLIDGTDFRTAQVKPGGSNQCAGPHLRIDDSGRPHYDPACTGVGTAPSNRAYEDQHPYEGFATFRLQTDYMHGRLSPGITMILDPSGIFGFVPGVAYRINDNLIASGQFFAIEGSRREGLATFRDRDQFQFRLTYQLN